MIKLFEDFTGSKVGKSGLLPFKVQSIVDQIDLYKISNGIFAVKIDDVRVRCYLFLRYQEFYEGASEKIRNNKFSIDEYIKWYQEFYKNKDLFTYAYDWCGFNIPSTSIEKCLESIRDPNEYDRIMKKIFTSSKISNGGDFYLLGVDSLKSDLLEHEMSHGMYFTDGIYKDKMDKITESLPKKTYEFLKSHIIDMGYNSIVVNDEIQAYMSTGLIDSMKKIPDIDRYLPKYREVFDTHLSENKHPKEIKINWWS